MSETAIARTDLSEVPDEGLIAEFERRRWDSEGDTIALYYQGIENRCLEELEEEPLVLDHGSSSIQTVASCVNRTRRRQGAPLVAASYWLGVCHVDKRQ